MLAGAIEQSLNAQGIPARVNGFGDYTTVGPPVVAVRASGDAFADLDAMAYSALLQIRSRARDVVAAEEIARAAVHHVLSLDRATLTWTPPATAVGAPTRQYKLEAIVVLNRWVAFATPEPGEETSSNLSLFVTEL